MRYVMVNNDFTHVFVYTFQEMLFSLAHGTKLKIYGYSDDDIEIDFLVREAKELSGLDAGG